MLENHKIGPKSVLGRQKKTTACLKQSTRGICIRTSISWQCKLLSKELWICFANERIPINPWNLIVHGLYIVLFSNNIFSIRYRLKVCFTMTRSQSEGTATQDKLQWHVPKNKTLHKISLKPGLNLSIFQGSTPMSFKSLIYYKIVLLTLLEETTLRIIYFCW